MQKGWFLKWVSLSKSMWRWYLPSLHVYYHKPDHCVRVCLKIEWKSEKAISSTQLRNKKALYMLTCMGLGLTRRSFCANGWLHTNAPALHIYLPWVSVFSHYVHVRWWGCCRKSILHENRIVCGAPLFVYSLGLKRRRCEGAEWKICCILCNRSI